MMVAPIAVVMFVVISFVLFYGLRGKNLEQVEVTGLLESQQKKSIYTLIALVVVLFSNSPIEPYYSGMNLNEKAVLLTFGLLMFVQLFSILSWKDTKKIHIKLFSLRRRFFNRLFFHLHRLSRSSGRASFLFFVFTTVNAADDRCVISDNYN